MPFTYEYPRPALTVDCVIFGLDEKDLKIALIQRAQEPFAGVWALPGGFVRVDESVDDAARRELREEAGISNMYLEQIGAIGTVNRDPRERVVTVAYFALVNIRDHAVRADTDARDAAWFPVNDMPSLAFDHEEIVQAAFRKLKTRIRHQPIGFELLSETFTLTELQHLYEAVLERTLDKRNFRRKILATGFVVETNEIELDVAHRAARLYRFDSETYERLRNEGFLFEI